MLRSTVSRMRAVRALFDSLQGKVQEMKNTLFHKVAMHAPCYVDGKLAMKISTREVMFHTGERRVLKDADAVKIPA